MARKESLTRKEKQMLKEVHEGINYIRYDIKVNGQSGLEPILMESHKKLSNLEKRTDFLEKLTVKTRTSYELFQSLRNWSDQRRWVGFLFRFVFSKNVLKIILVFIVFLIATIFGEVSLEAIKKLISILF